MVQQITSQWDNCILVTAPKIFEGHRFPLSAILYVIYVFYSFQLFTHLGSLDFCTPYSFPI